VSGDLQRCLWRDNLDPDGQVKVIIIKTLIYGVRCVSAQMEAVMVRLAEGLRDKFPLLSDFLLNSRYVDDLADSSALFAELKKMINSADSLLVSVGLRCKGWSFSGEDPHPDTSDNGETVDVAGISWATKLDTLEVKVPPLHFGKKARVRRSLSPLMSPAARSSVAMGPSGISWVNSHL